jgi:SAM-dependent methyltransferase
MSEVEVGRLYDSLHRLERRLRRRPTYPVHKSIRFPEPGVPDIYDWIAAQVELPKDAKILDAGCGVGFGVLRLAQLTGSEVTGISLSLDEIERAQQVAAQEDLREAVHYRQASFDHLPAEAYDLVMAVESLKHSSNIEISLRSMCTALRKGGVIVIVEDVATGDENCISARCLTRDWRLTKLYGEADYIDVLGSSNCRVIDLTDGVKRPRDSILRLGLALLEPLTRLSRGRCLLALQAVRGGLHMQRLYAKGSMAYKAIVYTRDRRR